MAHHRTISEEGSVTTHHFPGDGATSRLHIDDAEPAADGSVHVVLSGELDDEETDRLRAAMQDVVTRWAPAPIRVDASGLRFLDAGGIRALLVCRLAIEHAGSHMSIPRASVSAFRVLEITGLLEVFGVVEQTDSRPERRVHRAASPPPA